VFGAYGAWLKAFAGAQINAPATQAQALVREYPRSTQSVKDQAQAFPTLLTAAQQAIDRRTPHTESQAQDALKALDRSVRQAQALYARVRLAVIQGEFR